MINPFEREHADAWGTDFVDVESLNKRASDLVVGRIREVREAARSGAPLRSSSILILGPAGAGKTHLFGRWRRASGVEATFVLIRPEIGVEPSPRHVLAAVLDSLQRTSYGSTHRQLDIVVGSLLGSLKNEGVRFPNAVLDAWRQLSADDRQTGIWSCLEEIEQRYEQIDPVWIDRLLRTPFSDANERRAAMTWLSGREPDEVQLARLGLTSALPDTSVMQAIRSLAVVAAFGAPVVLVFDQLENLLGDGQEGHVRAHAQLISELFDTVPGLVMVQMALDAEWDRRIRPLLSASARTRVEAARVELELPLPPEREALIRGWVGKLDEQQRGGPFPAPFTEAQLRAWMTEPGMTPRQLMIACREALAHKQEQPDPEPQPATTAEAASAPTLDERLEHLWEGYLERARLEVEAAAQEKRGLDRTRMRAALLVALRIVGERTAAPSTSRAHHDLVLGEGDGVLRVYVLQQAHWRSVAAALERALEEPRVRVIRERAFPIPPNWKKVAEQLVALRARQPLAVIDADRNDLVQLLALHDLVAAARSQDLADAAGHVIAEKDVIAWVERALVPSRWRIMREAMGLPAVSHDGEPEERIEPAASTARTLPTGVPVVTGDGLAWTVLCRLRLASIDRILREVRLTDRNRRRAEVKQELSALGARVRWFGRSVVAIAQGEELAIGVPPVRGSAA